MSTVTTERPRGKAAALSQTLQQRYAERAQLESRLAELPGLEEQARLEALKANPAARSDGLNSPAQKLAREFKEKSAALDRLNAEISAVERVVAIARREDLELALAETEQEAGKLAKAEEALWKEAGAKLAELAEVYGRLRDDVWEPREKRRDEIRHGSMASLLNSPEAEETFSGVWRSPVRPLPTNFPSFLSLLAEAALDPRSLGYRAASGAAHLDGEDRLIELVPDLVGPLTRVVALLTTERYQPDAGGPQGW
jgi:hypothetical protein